MGQLFKEAFADAPIRQDLMDFFGDVMVERIMLKKSMHLVKMYISYNKLITKDHIYALEQNLNDQMFAQRGLSVQIIEDYHLSEQYDENYVVEHYYDSLLLELEHYDRLMLTVLRKRMPQLLDNKLVLTLPDSFVARQKETQICEVFDRVFQERFHLPIETVVKYTEAEESNYRKEMEERAVRRLEAISMEQYAGPAPDCVSEDEMLGSALPVEAEAKAKAGKAQAVQKQEPQDAQSAKNTEKNIGKNAEQGKTFSAKGTYEGKGMKGKKSGGAFGSRDKLKMSDNPDVVYGRDFDGTAEPIESIVDEVGTVIIHGEVLAFDEVTFKTGNHLLKYTISDYTDSMRIKIFLPEELADEMRPLIKKGDFVLAKGMPKNDTFDKELELMNLYGLKKIKSFKEVREDYAVRKRVELHCHTKMSDMDACVEADVIVKTAKRFGHQAVALTDHGNVQGYPVAFHALDKKDPFKVLYGLEAYMVDDTKQIVVNEKGQSLADAFVVFDIETTGFVPKMNKIIEIGAVKVVNGEIVERFSELINPQEPIPLEIEKLTSISDSQVMDKETIEVILPRFLDFCKGCVLVAHNAKFDTSFIRYYAEKLGYTYDFTHTDTIELARLLMKKMGKYTLDHLAKELNIPAFHHHRAVDDAEATALIFVKFVAMLRERKIETLAQLNEIGEFTPDKIADLYPHHCVILAKNEVGRRNLYRLVSLSHLQYFGRFPKIPKSKLTEYREGLIIGSGCASGELFDALVNERPEEEISRIVDFYDYLEIQPIGNNLWQLERSKLPTLKSREDLINVNKRIVALGEAHGKPVCATGDVHFLEPEDAVYRTIILAGRKLDKVYNYADSMYFHTTEEMLEEFSYLGTDKADEVVVRNTNMIADMCDYITPVRPDKCPPVIADSDKTLRTICYNRAHELYGDPLPQIVEERLEKELKSIIGNGFAVMYIIAQKLVWKSVEDGYLVGSRGSVGSSFVATMAGITEVNPLAPHYYCVDCHYSDFDSEDVKAYAGKAGCDMPDKVCPHCGKVMKKDGFDIPFETFLGFKGDKEPDIDLNFSGEYQSKAHKYTEVIFGAGQTYRAGTIGTVADKTAFGYIKNFYKERGIEKKDAEVDRLVPGLVGIRRTTGQHPGGIVVLPVGEDINSFTPTQHPANDMETDIVTTHFDYHSIDHNLLKLDILGHDDPTMIRKLQDLTGIDPTTIPLDDKGVMSLFQNTDALGITPADIGGTPLGALGIPEFGTDFAMQMLIDAQPTSFSDLVRIAGLSHGTDVWLGNAKDLILSGTATISTAICTRDDIMLYLIQMGVESSLSFTIMEAVRKGKGLKPEWEEAMRAQNVPEWYIESCKKIKYMFPKAHAAAYVMMAWRIAYCKINYPLAYYCAYFSIRASAFSYEMMCLGKARLEEHMDRIARMIETKDKALTPKDEVTYKDMRIVQEMYARGFEFTPIDLYKAQANYFQIVDGKIMPSFTAIDGLGDKNAELIEDEARKGEFLSKQDFAQRTKTSATIMETMERLGILGNMTESNQISLFDLL
ncbi:MAG: PolC-type DNA polymerase III [Lachnospiraceae bacterium]|nr:PolC-type DNA polymerase III [Lachnospiraceae bacterium]